MRWPGRKLRRWRVRSRCRVPCPTRRGRRKSSAIRVRWFGRASASIDRHHAASDGHARLQAATPRRTRAKPLLRALPVGFRSRPITPFTWGHRPVHGPADMSASCRRVGVVVRHREPNRDTSPDVTRPSAVPPPLGGWHASCLYSGYVCHTVSRRSLADLFARWVLRARAGKRCGMACRGGKSCGRSRR